jgi:hypothetical protein
MNRRELLKWLPTASAAAVIPITAEKKEPNPNWGLHGDWFYRWSGWICLPNQDVLVGHWVAKRPDDPFAWGVYSCYPGTTWKFSLDQLFDTSVQSDQSLPNSETPAEKLEEFKTHAFHRLIAYIDKHDRDLRRPDHE